MPIGPTHECDWTPGALERIVAEAFSPRLTSGSTAQLAVIAAHPTRWYLYTLPLIVGSIVAVPAGVALLQLAAERMPHLRRLAGTS